MRNNDADRWVGSTSAEMRQGTVSGARRPLPPEVYRRRRWAALGVLVVAVVTVVMLTTVIVGGGAGNNTAFDSAVDGDVGDAGGTGALLTGEGGVLEASASAGPLPGVPVVSTVGALPPGGEVTERGHGTWHGVGAVGAVAGDPQAEGTRTITYVVEVEDGLDTASFGGGDSFSAMVDATLADPRSWIGGNGGNGGEAAGGGGSGGRIAFRHISVADTDTDTPDLRIRLTTPNTTRELCGEEIDLETSCFVGGGDRSGDAARGRVVINVARWVRGAVTFAGDLGSYRQYVLNHEVGHGIGYASHQPCPGDGVLAPVMMQQTLSLNNRDLVDLDAGAEYMPEDRGGADHEAWLGAVCVANAWPHPEG